MAYRRLHKRKAVPLDIRETQLVLAEAKEHLNGTMTPEKQRLYDDTQGKPTVSTMTAKPNWHLTEKKKETEEEKRKKRLIYGS